ncbi:protein kinase domain-containing protein [Candidatus Magnetominusculus dajiuhuensis]|uniref:protein kinase domain-containing protein n=1 Tax=Candidatus Magnetominusculus dajiuhuensis TaxID=3137712 RepID=UPI003B43BE25
MADAGWAVGDVILDLYEVREVFTSGGMGLVYRIYHKGWNSDMAVKSPRAEYFRTETQKSGFEREAQTWMDLGLHPNIVSCYYVRRISGVPCVFAEYLEGGSLRDWIKQGKLKSVEVIIDTAIQFATGLDYAHEKGLIHQDIKPANVMMTSDGIAKVTDFGLARAQSLSAAESPHDTPPQPQHRQNHLSSCGMTPAYCSCEQANHSPLTLKTDIWSWGVSILEIFVGSVTWLSGNVAAIVLDDYLMNPPTDANAVRMPTPIASLLRRCFTQDPAGRPANMREIITELKQIYRDITGKDYPRGEYLAGRLTADSLNNRAVSFLDLGRSSEVAGVWKEALRVDPHHIESTFNLALYEWKLCAIGQSDIFRRFDEIMRNQTLKHRDYNLIGRMYMFFGEYGKALDAMWRGFNNEGAASSDETKALITALCAEGRHSSKKDDTAAMAIWKDVEKYSRLIIEGGSRDIRIIAAHAVSLMRQGRAADSVAFYDKMRLDNPSLPNSVVAAALGYLPGHEVIRTFEGHSGIVSMVILSADGKTAVSAGTEDRSVRLWDMDTGECLHTLDGHNDWVTCVCFSADGNSVISGSLDKTLRFWDIKRGKNLKVFDAHKDGVTAVMAGADGRHIISGGNDAVINIWSSGGSGNLVRTLEGHSGRITSLSAGQRGPYVLSASSDKTIRLWNITTGKCLMVMAGHGGAVNHIAKADNSSYILTSGEDMTIRLWDSADGKHLRTFKGHSSAVTAAAFMPNGRGFISGSTDNTLCRWDIESGQREYVLKRFEGPSLALSHDGKTAIYSVWNGVRVVNILNRFVLPYALAVPVSSEEAGRREGGFQTILDEAERLITGGSLHGVPELIKKGRQIKGYERDRDALKLMERLSRVFPRKTIQGAWEAGGVQGHEGAINAVAASKDGKYVITGSAGCTVALWDASSMNRLKTFKGHEGAAIAVDICGRYILSGGEDATLRLWDMETGECLWVFSGHSAPVTAATISRDGKYAVSGSLDGSIVLIDIMARLDLRVFFERNSRVTCVVLTPDIRSVIAGYEDGSLRVWDIDTEGCTTLMKPYNNSVSSVAISPDLKSVVATGQFDNNFHIWDIGTRKLSRSFKGHAGGVMAACFSPDGKFIISGSLDGTTRLWDAGTGRVSRTFTGHGGGVSAVCFGPDGWYAWSGGADHTLRAFYVDWELEVRDLKDWDDGAAAYLELFVSIHTPFIKNSFTRRAIPAWDETDFASLLSELALRGFGWLRPEGVRAKLDELQQAAVIRQRHSEESFNEAITQAKELMTIGSYSAALAEINKARSISGYNKEAVALRLIEEMSMMFPRTRLASSLRLHVLRGHGGGIVAAAFTTDERFAVTACKDNRVRIWELSTGKCQMTLSGSPVTALLMCDGGRVISGAADGTLRLWDIKTGEVKKAFKCHTAQINSLCGARGGRFFLSAANDGLMILWDVGTGERVKVYKCPSNSVTCAAIDEDLAFIASGSTDRNIRLWDCASGAVTKILAGHTDTVMAVSISPDGTSIVSGGAERIVRLWDSATGENTSIFEGHSGAVTSVQISPDGRFFISGSMDGSALLWDMAQPGGYAAFGGHTAAISNVSLSPSADMMITASEDKTAFVWYLQWSFTIRDFTDWVEGALPYLKRFLSKHRKIVNDTLAPVGSPMLKDEDTAKLLAELKRRGYGWLFPDGVTAKFHELKSEIDIHWKESVAQYNGLLKGGVDYMKEKQYVKAIESLSMAHALRGFEREEQPLRLLDKMHSVFPKGKLSDVWRVKYLVGHRGKITALVVLSNNGHAVTASADKTLRFWDINTGKCIRVFEGHTAAVTSVGLTADNRSVVSAGADGTIRQWDVLSGECVRVIEGHKDIVTAVVTAPDNRRILSGSADGTIKLWDSFTGDCLNTYPYTSGKLAALAISPDCMYYFSGGAGAEFWDLSTGQQIHKFKGLTTASVTSLAVTPNGRYILIADADKAARLWDVPTGESFRTFGWKLGRPASAAITPNGKYAVIGGEDGSLRFYDILSGELSKAVHWHTGALAAIAISPDCRYIVTGGDDAVAGVWYADWQITVKKLTEWDEGARPFLEIFLSLATSGKYPPVKKPQWTEEDFSALLKDLSLRGYGWLSADGIKNKLNEMAADWKTILSERRHLFEKEFRPAR